MNQAALKQARDGVKLLIKESPEKITINRYPMVDDGAGNGVLVPDLTGVPEEVEMTVRISHERRYPQMAQEINAGLSTNLSRFIMTDYQSPIYNSETFEAIDRGWRIGPVDTLKKFGGVIGYQAPLVEAEPDASS